MRIGDKFYSLDHPIPIYYSVPGTENDTIGKSFTVSSMPAGRAGSMTRQYRIAELPMESYEPSIRSLYQDLETQAAIPFAGKVLSF